MQVAGKIPVTDEALTNLRAGLITIGHGFGFESTPLQRGVCKLSVPGGCLFQLGVGLDVTADAYRWGAPETRQCAMHLDNHCCELFRRDLMMPDIAADDLRDPRPVLVCYHLLPDFLSFSIRGNDVKEPTSESHERRTNGWKIKAPCRRSRTPGGHSAV
jgi:hypothetical protein